jgi:hypothetical protein
VGSAISSFPFFGLIPIMVRSVSTKNKINLQILKMLLNEKSTSGEVLCIFFLG